MGGCCCSSRRSHLHGTPVYYYCPPALEEQSITSVDGAASTITTGLLIGLDLEASIPDTFRAPAAPLPYDVLLGRPQSTDNESARERVIASNFQALTTCGDFEESNCKIQATTLLHSPRKPELSKVEELTSLVADEEDGCPICLEEYDPENPKLLTTCDHHFHLSCILEWMERSDACPICDQEMIFDQTFH